MGDGWLAGLDAEKSGASVREVVRPPPTDHTVQRIGEIVVLVFDTNAQGSGDTS
jgi:hypothetical protein